MRTTIWELTPAGWMLSRQARLAALHDAPSAFGTTYDEAAAWSAEQWQAAAALPCWVAFPHEDGEDDEEEDDEVDPGYPVGMVRVVEGAEGTDPELVSLWVAPVARGTSVATELVEEVVDHVAQQGCSRLTLRVTTDNARARAFYTRLGFEPTGVTDELPDGRPEIEMARAITAR